MYCGQSGYVLNKPRSVVKRMMTSMLIMMIADVALNAIRIWSSDMLDTVLKVTDFDNSNFKSDKIMYPSAQDGDVRVT